MNEKNKKILIWTAIITFLLALSIWLPLILFAPNGYTTNKDLKSLYENQLAVDGDVASTYQDYRLLYGIELFGMYKDAKEPFFIKANNSIQNQKNNYTCETCFIFSAGEKQFFVEITDSVSGNISAGNIELTLDDSSETQATYQFYRLINDDSTTLYLNVNDSWYAYNYTSSENLIGIDFDNFLQKTQESAYPRLMYSKDNHYYVFIDQIPFDNVFCKAMLNGSGGTGEAVLVSFDPDTYKPKSVFAYERPLNYNLLSTIANQDSVLKTLCDQKDVTVTPSFTFSQWGNKIDKFDVSSLNATNVESLDFAFEPLINYLT